MRLDVAAGIFLQLVRAETVTCAARLTGQLVVVRSFAISAR